MDSLESVESDEQQAVALLKSARVRREQLAQQALEQEALAAKMKHNEYLAAVAALAPRAVLGVTYEQLRKHSTHTAVRFVHVHQDVRTLLIAALPAESEEMFCKLCSAVVQRLMQDLGSQREVKEHLAVLKASSETKRYFDPELHNAVTVIAAEGKNQFMKHSLLSEVLTAWALCWGKAVNYEEKE